MATNLGLRRAYTVWATVYDPIVRFLRWSRRRSLALLDIRPSDTVLVLGCGTGADFEFLPREAEVTAVDLTPAMLRRAAAKIGDRCIRLEEMDVMDLRFSANTFDKAVLHLILAVVPDPVRALQEAERVTKPGGLMVVLDKFWNRPGRPPVLLRIANAILGGYVTAVNRNFRTILANTSLEVIQENLLGLGGLYYLYLLRKPAASRREIECADGPKPFAGDGVAVPEGPQGVRSPAPGPDSGNPPWKWPALRTKL